MKANIEAALATLSAAPPLPDIAIRIASSPGETKPIGKGEKA